MAGESKLERYARREVKKAGGEMYKFVSPGRRNVPDDIIIWPCKDAILHFAEFKDEGQEPTKGQAREHVRLQMLGCVVLVFSTKAAFDSYVKRMRP